MIPDTPGRKPLEEDCDNCPVFFKCDQLPPCATRTSAQPSDAQQRIEQVTDTLQERINDKSGECGNEDYYDGVRDAYKEAIALLHGGVSE